MMAKDEMSVPGLVMNAFSPVSDHSPLPRSVARVLKPAVSLPASGSVPAMEQIFRPDDDVWQPGALLLLGAEARDGETGRHGHHGRDRERLIGAGHLLDGEHRVEDA